MKRILKKILTYVVTAAIIIALIPGVSAPVFAMPALAVDLGAASLSGGSYYYSSASVTGIGIKTILISFSDNVTSGDEIILPAATTGFTVSSSSAGNKYAKRINLDGSIAASAVQDYLRSVEFKIASATQSVEITVTTDNIVNDTYYNTDTEHYYQYIPSTATSWTDAYTNAKEMTYMGMTGYLATITSVEEDTFVNELSDGKTGWLGGTILTNTGTSGTLYYSGFNTGSVVSTGWYWACGPERGDTFYNVNSLLPGGANASNAATQDAANTAYYYNWARGDISYEPNNDAGDEHCLTTLAVTISGSTNYGKHGTTFSWNDKGYNTAGADTWDPKGYFVEYGDQDTGDSGSGSVAFASDSGNLAEPSDIELTTVAWLSSATYTCDIDLPATAKMVTISVDSGSFSVPSLGSLTFLGGTSGTSYIQSYSSGADFSSAVFSFTDVSAAEDLLDDIVYTPVGLTAQTITAVSSAVSPQGSDIYFEGHYYRYVDSGFKSIDWPSAVSAAGITADPYFDGRGYIAAATSQPENSILLRLVDNGGLGSDHWDDAWMGGLWQRNTGTNASPSITRGTDGNEITYDDLVYFIENDTVPNVLLDYSDTYGDFDGGDSSTFIHANPGTVRYYWIDGPEAGDEISNNTADFAPWHATSGSQDEPNGGDFVYIGWEGAYWDDLSAFSSGSTYDKLDGYIVEFSGFNGGSTEGIIKEDTKTTAVDGTAPVLTAGSVNRTSDSAATVKFTSSEEGHYYYDVVEDGAAEPSIDTSGAGTDCTTSETTISLISLADGAKDIYIKAKDSFGNVSSALKIDIPAYSTSDGNDSHHSKTQTDTGAPVIVNGTSYSAGDAKTSTEDGKTKTTVTVDTNKLQTILDSQDENPSVIVPVTGNAQVASGILTGQMISDMEGRGADLSLRTDTATYTLPAKEINIDTVSEQLGENISLSDIVVNMEIAEPSEATVSVVENAAESGGYTIMIPALDFNITCTYKGKTVEAEVFNVYVQRSVLIPDGVDPEKITTGVVVKPDGTSYHVPTQITVVDGKYYAVIKSLTNSTYTVVWHPVEFRDVAAHWAKKAIDDMGSRMVVNGVAGGLFEPDRNITRAEFAAIMVRALGLDAGMGDNTFSDVRGSDWYCGYVETAIQYGIIKGYGDGTFGPKDSITREQAMTMVARAMDITGLKPDMTAAETTALLAEYSDSAGASAYAGASIASCVETGVVLGRSDGVIAPKESITRAEVAAIVQRLLQKSKLI